MPNASEASPNLAKVARRGVPVRVVALKADAYWSDDNSVIISLTTKYSNVERTYSVPLECLRSLIVDLQKLEPDTLFESTLSPKHPTLSRSIAPSANPDIKHDAKQ